MNVKGFSIVVGSVAAMGGVVIGIIAVNSYRPVHLSLLDVLRTGDVAWLARPRMALGLSLFFGGWIGFAALGVYLFRRLRSHK